MIKKILTHFKDVSKNPYLLLFLFYKYIFFVFFGFKTKPILLKNLLLSPDVNKSFIRWGDGETNSALGISFSFENSSYKLKKYLNKILDYNGNKIIVGLPIDFINKVELETKHIKIWKTTRLFFSLKLNKNKIYSDAFFFRNIGGLQEFIKFYNNKKLYVISNRNTLSKLKNNINYIGTFEIPFTNAFDNYISIKKGIIDNVKFLKDKEKIIFIISGGPFAKALSYDLTIENNLICHDVGAFFDIYL